MARPSKRKLAYKSRIRSDDGKLIPGTEVDEAEQALQEDWQVQEDDTHELFENVRNNSSVADFNPLDINNILHDDGTSYKRPRGGHYSKASNYTIYRRRKEAKTVKSSAKLENYGFFSFENDSAIEQKEEKLSRNAQELMKIEALYDDLCDFNRPVMNQKEEKSQVYYYNQARYLAIQYYFKHRMEGKNKGQSAKEAAKFFWPNGSKFYRNKAIIRWATEYLDNNILSDHSQGIHVKRVSFLSDNDVKMKVLDMVKKTQAKYRTLDGILKFINEDIVPSLLGVTGTVGKTTLAKYLYEWGYSYRKNEKTIFFDGHERKDVVAYRQEWSKRMLQYMERSEFYEGEFQDEVIEPVLKEGEKKIVFVTHDESTFYANDGKRIFGFWMVKTIFVRKVLDLRLWLASSNVLATVR